MDDPKLTHLLRLPWTFMREATPEGDTILRVREIPSAVGVGDTDAELEADVWASLRASLEAYLEFGDPVPLPAGVKLPWQGSRRPQQAPRIIVRKSIRYASSAETASAAGSPH